MRPFFKFLLVLLILAGGLFIAWTLIKTKPVAERKPISIGTPVVDVIPAKATREQVRITAMGTVIPAREVGVQPQVSGHIVKVGPGLIPGGRLRKGDLLFRIDDRDYTIAKDQRKAEVARALMDLKMEKGKKTIAEREWEMLSSEIPTTAEGRELALRNPQLKKVVAALETARGALRKAMLDMERTKINAPFNAFVKEKFADLGQPVTPGFRLATLVGTDTFWVRISVPMSRLPWIRIPGVNATEGSPAIVIQESRDVTAQVTRQGRILRLLGDLDPVGRMARLLVAVADPFSIRNSEPADKKVSQPSEKTNALPLLLGTYVKVEIQGPVLEDVIVIPRKALREGDKVWLMSDEKRLTIRNLDVVWRRKAEVLVWGPNPGELVITSRIPAPVEGMALRIAGSEDVNSL